MGNSHLGRTDFIPAEKRGKGDNKLNQYKVIQTSI